MRATPLSSVLFLNNLNRWLKDPLGLPRPVHHLLLVIGDEGLEPDFAFYYRTRFDRHSRRFRLAAQVNCKLHRA